MFYKLIFNGNDKRKKITEETKTFEGLSSFAKKVFNIVSEDIGFLYCGSEDVSSYEISCDEDLEYVLEVVQAFNSKNKFIDIKVIENFEMSPENPERFSMAGESEIRQSLVENPVLLQEKEELIKEEDISKEAVMGDVVDEQQDEVTLDEIAKVEEDVVDEIPKIEEDFVDDNMKKQEEPVVDDDMVKDELDLALETMVNKIKESFIVDKKETENELLESKLSSILNETLTCIKKDIQKKPKKKKNKRVKQQENLLKKYNNIKEKAKVKIEQSLQKINEVYEKLDQDYKEKTTEFNVCIRETNEEEMHDEKEVLIMENCRLQKEIEHLMSKCESKSECNTDSKHEFETVHYGIVCDNCGVSDFKGRRYKCMITPDFDLCEKCERSIDHAHPMVRMVNSTPHTRKLDWGFHNMRSRPWFQKAMNIELTEEQKEMNQEEKKKCWGGRRRCPRGMGPFNMFGPFANAGFKGRKFRNQNKIEDLPQKLKQSMDLIGAEIVKVFNPKTEKAPELKKDEIIVKVPIKQEKEDFIIEQESNIENKECEKVVDEEMDKEEEIRNKKIRERKDFVKALLENQDINEEVLHFFVTCNLEMTPADFYQAVQDQKKYFMSN